MDLHLIYGFDYLDIRHSREWDSWLRPRILALLTNPASRLSALAADLVGG